jgi:serine/threonine protein kinase
MNLSGRTLGKYKLLEQLGQGGMAQVYKAVQPTIDRMVAIKVLHSHLAQSEDLIERFKREARALGQLQHPHIVQVIDFDIEDDIYFMVVDYIAGTTLRAYLDDRQKLSCGEALMLVEQLTDALAYVHRNGTIHRDIKPGNVLLKEQQPLHAVLTDFGVGRLLNDATMTAAGSIIGTPAYMSPEAVLGQRVDERSDIYSLGVVLYEMVTGRVPYTGDTPMSVIMKQVHDPLPSPREFSPDLPSVVVRLIEKMLEKEPDQRFQAASEVLPAVQETHASLGESHTTIALNDNTAFSASLPPQHAPAAKPGAGMKTTSFSPPAPPEETSGKEEPATPAPEPETPPQRSRFVLMAVAAVGMLVLAAVGLWMWREQPEAMQVAATTDNLTTTADTAAVADAPISPAASPSAALVLTATVALTPTATSPAVAPTAPGEAEVVPLTEPGQMGQMMFAASESLPLGSFAVQVEHAPLPPAGNHYNVWLRSPEGSLHNVGQAAVEHGYNGHIFLRGSFESLDPVFADVASGVLISIEPDGEGGNPPAQPTGPIAYSGQLSETFAAEMQRVLVRAPDTGDDGERGLLAGAREQLFVAIQHAQFCIDALEKDDLAEAKMHTEHVVNILDGEEGEFFGDLNLDGQAQNPGDGFGVGDYLRESRRHIEQALERVSPNARRLYHAERATSAIESSLEGVDRVIDESLTLIATDTLAEAQPFAEDMLAQLNALVAGASTGEVVAAAHEHALALAAIPLIAEHGHVAAPDGVAEAVPGRVGFMRFANGTGGVRAGSFFVQIARADPLPPGAHYDAWLLKERSTGGEEADTDASGEATAPLFLGQFDGLNGYLHLTGSHDKNLLDSYQRLVVSVEQTEANLVPAETFAFEARLASEGGEEALRLISGENEDQPGSLYGAKEQTLVAIQHKGFAQDELDGGNLAEAKRHTEHVINVLDGEEGEHFGDVNFDGQAQNPGDGVGVRGYLEQLTAEMESIQQADGLTADQRFYASLVITTSTQRMEKTEEAIQQALKVIASDTQEEARPFLAELELLLDEVLNGHDMDENGVVDPLVGEGGILVAQELVLALHEVHIFPAQPE